MNINEKIQTKFKSILESDSYSVITAYDAEEDETECGEVVAINISAVEDMGNTGCNDNKFTLVFNGQTLAPEDKNKTKLNAIFAEVMKKLGEVSVDELTEDIGDVADFSVTGSTFQSDGESYNFGITAELVVCNVDFSEN